MRPPEVFTNQEVVNYTKFDSARVVEQR
jgi:hypothetical protein